jgi:hypothetical protein
MADGCSRWRWLWMPLCALLAPGCEQDGGQDAGPPVQRGAEVSGSRSDTSPPLRDIPPTRESQEKRIHPIGRLPRPPKEGSDGGGDDTDR